MYTNGGDANGELVVDGDIEAIHFRSGARRFDVNDFDAAEDFVDVRVEPMAIRASPYDDEGNFSGFDNVINGLSCLNDWR